MKDDLIFVAMEDWDEMWRRNQPIAAEFARRVPTRKLLYMGLPIDISHGLRRGSLEPIRRAWQARKELKSPDGFPNIFLFNPVKWLPNTLPGCQLINRWMERRQLRHSVRKAGLSSPILWLNPHYALHLLGRVGESLVVYDIGDDWTQIKQAEWVRRQTIAEDAELCHRADLLIVVSEHLKELKKKLAPCIHVIPNGVYVERYTGIATGQIEPHPALREWPRPIFAYTGTIHKERVDLPMVEAIANAYPQATIALIGPVMLEAKDTARLKAHPNVKLPGTFPFEEMPRVMSAFDVCLVPHVLSPFTESLSPLKLYEYLASGLPIAATPVPGFRDYPKWVHLAKGPDAMIKAIAQALKEPKQNRKRRQELASIHSWHARMDAIEAAIETTKSKRRLCQERP